MTESYFHVYPKVLFTCLLLCGVVDSSFPILTPNPPSRSKSILRITPNLSSYTDDEDPRAIMQTAVFVFGKNIYVGGRNSLYHLHENLTLIAKFSTGPKPDNVRCFHPSFPCNETLTMTDNDNKVLEILNFKNKIMLLTCGTLYLGICQIIDISQGFKGEEKWIGPFDEPVGLVSSKKSVSVVSYLKPEYLTDSSYRPILSVASFYDGRPLLRSPPSVSTRVLVEEDGEFHFEYPYQNSTAFSGFNIHQRFRKSFKVDYIYGFDIGDYIYFVINQHVSPDSREMETRLARVCSKDSSFSSYSEVRITCPHLSDFYNFASAAYLGPTSSYQKSKRTHMPKLVIVKYPDSFGFQDVSLYVAFLNSPPGRVVLDRSKGSVVCSFPMFEVESVFKKAFRDCDSGEGKLLKHVTGDDLNCTKDVDPVNSGIECGSAFNRYIEGQRTIMGEVRTHLGAYITSLAVVNQSSLAVAAVGTDKDDVIKAVLEDRLDHHLFTIKVANETEDDSEKRGIRRSNTVDSYRRNVYFLTGRKVVKIPIVSCIVYPDCASCLRTDDPLNCGWCGDHCSTKDECAKPHLFDTINCRPSINKDPIVPIVPIVSCILYPDCNSCLRTDDSLNCVWCGDHCSTKDECKKPNLFDEVYCRPYISEVFPLIGTTKGDNSITIRGNNFRLPPPYIPYNSTLVVTVSGSPCKTYLWEREKIGCMVSYCRLGCNLGCILECISGNIKDVSGQVTVEMQELAPETGVKGTAVSSEIFTFVTTKFYGVYPSYGPISGGTNLTLYGENLGVGQIHVISVDGMLCSNASDQFKAFENVAWCITSKFISYGEALNRKVKMYINRAEVPIVSAPFKLHHKHLSTNFRYLPDPKIHSIYPQVTTLRGAKNLTITGYRLDSVAFPKVIVNFSTSVTGQKLEFGQPCSSPYDKGTKMTCPTPSINIAEADASSETKPLVTQVGFIMDGVTELRDLASKNDSKFRLLYYPDPVYYPFEEDDYVRELDHDATWLEIKGKYLNLVNDVSDISVMIDGNLNCDVTALSEDKLNCTLPVIDPDFRGNQARFIVKVAVGSLNFRLGYLTFKENSNPYVIGYYVIYGLFGTISAYFCFTYVRKRWNSMKNWYMKYTARKKEAQYRAAYTAERQFDENASSRRQNDYHVEPRRSVEETLNSTATTQVRERKRSSDDETQSRNLNAEVLPVMEKEYDWVFSTTDEELTTVNGHPIEDEAQSRDSMTGKISPTAADVQPLTVPVDVHTPTVPSDVQLPTIPAGVTVDPKAIEALSYLLMTGKVNLTPAAPISPGIDNSQRGSDTDPSGLSYEQPDTDMPTSPHLSEIIGKNYQDDDPSSWNYAFSNVSTSFSLPSTEGDDSYDDDPSRWSGGQSDMSTSPPLPDKKRNSHDDEPRAWNIGRSSTSDSSVSGRSKFCVDDETIRLLKSENKFIPMEQLVVGEVVGVGNFGLVFIGKLKQPPKEENVTVAVKSLRRNTSRAEMEKFVKEGRMMKDFDHPNILMLIGIGFDNRGWPMIITPFMKHGDLHSLLKSDYFNPTKGELLEFGAQIACGMNYLSKNKFVHRDLATRNCMLGDKNTVKIADFGLSRDVYTSNYYCSENNKVPLPLKWMAPESLVLGVYSSKSDVWSFGVVLWELMTRGVTPYHELPNSKILLDYLRQGRRLQQPSCCPDRLYEIMLCCWHPDREKRPTFNELENQIKLLIHTLEYKFKKQFVRLEVTYVNVPKLTKM